MHFQIPLEVYAKMVAVCPIKCTTCNTTFHIQVPGVMPQPAAGAFFNFPGTVPSTTPGTGPGPGPGPGLGPNPAPAAHISPAAAAAASARKAQMEKKQVLIDPLPNYVSILTLKCKYVPRSMPHLPHDKLLEL